MNRRVLLTGLLLVGCGRSELGDDEIFGTADSGVDAAMNTDDGSVDVGIIPLDATAQLDAGCGPGNCAGCCQDDGTCVGHPTVEACGIGGEACQKCAPGPDSFCGKPGPGCITQLKECTPENCNGCCFLYPKPQFQFCATGVHKSSCGNRGEACHDCGQEACVAVSDGGGACKDSPPPLCSTSTCTGCCYGNICATGAQNIACGKGGVVCKDCSSSGLVCTAASCH